MRNYQIEQTTNRFATNYQTYEHSSCGATPNTYLPDFGLNPARIPRTELNSNSVQVESELRGIGASNLVNPQVPMAPQTVHHGFASIYKKNVPLVMPRPLVVEKDQRPLPFS
jgi:hypothetical protein